MLQYASCIVSKENFLSKEEMDSLTEEQGDVIDYLVLRMADYLVGFGASSFSFYLMESRLAIGRDMTLLMEPTIGTEELFHRAAVIATRTHHGQHHRPPCVHADLQPCFLAEKNFVQEV